MAQFPLKWTPREEQKKIVEFFAQSINKNKKFILIDAPVGVGKSFAAVLMANWYKEHKYKNAKFDIITNTKILQTQYTKEFDFIQSLWGKGNYQCEPLNMTCEEGCEMGTAHDEFCKECPYKTAFKNYTEAEMNITNFHLFCTFTVYLQHVLDKRGANVLFIDEAHDFDETFCSFIALNLGENIIKKWDLNSGLTDDFIKALYNIKTAYDFKILIENAITHILDRVDDLKRSIKKPSKAEAKKISNLVRCAEKYDKFLAEWDNNKYNWILEERKEWDAKTKKNWISFSLEPIWSSIYLKEAVWDNYDHVVFMSGTILDKELFCFLNGIDESEAAHIKIPSPFPIENRKIYYKKQGKMTYNEKTTTWKTYVPFIQKILDHHKGEKGIIHTNSFELAEWLRRDVKDTRLLFHDKENKESILDLHKTTTEPTVLVSPSMENGVDLKDDLSRFQIILKVPFPSLGSNRIKKRIDLKPNWYNWKTTIDIVQSYGRSIRSEEDWATTYILDSSLDTLIQKYQKFFPKYFTEAFK